MDVAGASAADTGVDWAERYEGLRRLAWEKQSPAWQGPALTLFLRQGLVAWIDAWSQQVGADAANAKQKRAVEPTTVVSLPGDVRRSLVGMLAEVILHHRPEMSS